MRVLIVAEGPHELSGALENLVKKLGGDSSSFESDRISSTKIHNHPGKLPRLTKRAISWLKVAEQSNFDAIILIVDEDGQNERIQQLQNAQDSSISQLPRAMGVAVRTFDAWMLADEKALSEVLGYSINKQPDPETIRNPKQVCQELLEKSSVQMRQREMYAEVSSNIDIDILSNRCQKGFKPFAENVKNVFQS